MSIRNLRRSVLAIAGVGVLAAGGLFAGRLLAGALPERSHDRFAPGIFGRIARSLDLTDEQKTQIKGILRSHAAEIDEQMKVSAEARRALHDEILADPVDEGAIRARAMDLARAQADGAVLVARIRAEVYPILTAGQREKIERYHERVRDYGDRARKAFERFLDGETS